MENLCSSLWHLDLRLNPDKGPAIKHSLYTKSSGRLNRRGSRRGVRSLAGSSSNAICRYDSVFNISVINNVRRATVKGRGGVVQTKSIFSCFLLHGRTGRVINCAGRRGIYVQVQMEVTSDLCCDVSRLSNCQTMDCSDNEPRLFVRHLFICAVLS